MTNFYLVLIFGDAMKSMKLKRLGVCHGSNLLCTWKQNLMRPVKEQQKNLPLLKPTVHQDLNYQINYEHDLGEHDDKVPHSEGLNRKRPYEKLNYFLDCQLIFW